MAEFQVVEDINLALSEKRFPTITMWNRLEGRSRTINFDRALKAEVRDPLWMLSRQWQMGEFLGDDAGSPISAKIHLTNTRLTKYQADSHSPKGFDYRSPLEAQVERRPIPLKTGDQKISLDLRLMMTRRWSKLIATQAQAIKDQYLILYPIALPNPLTKADAQVCAHAEDWQQFAAVAGRKMDGGSLFLYLKEAPANLASDNLNGLNAAEKTALDNLGVQFLDWFEKFFFQAENVEEDAWLPGHLEYQFSVSAPKNGAEKVMVAEEYYHGELDWYNLDIDPDQSELDQEAQPANVEGEETFSFFPSPLVFNGMPNTRWWEMEDRKTNFGDINPDTTDINKLLFIEFGLIYANDWFMVPLTQKVGSISQVEGLSVTNVFGERTWIEAAGSGSDEDWQRWNMYSLAIQGDDPVAADTSMILLPTVPKIQESKPFEQIVFIRDEIANMVWGIESIIPGPGGRSRRGGEAARQLRRYYKRILEESNPPEEPAPLFENEAKIRYRIMKSVPENWIPFIPVHVPGSNREIQLQRASMPRVLEGDPNPAEKIKPRTVLLREGLDSIPVSPYFVFDGEVGRAGAKVSQTFQRTRWNNGEVFNWFGVRKQTGRGEGKSGLAFDQIIPIRKKS